MTYDNGPICPHCGGQTHYYDKAKRIVKGKYGESKKIYVYRYRCSQCGEIHRVIPDTLIPFKHYEKEVIQGVIEGTITPETLGFEDYPSEMTMHRWRKDSSKQSNVGTLKQAMEIFAEENSDTLAHGVFDDEVEALFPEYELLKKGEPDTLERDQTWIDSVMSKIHKSPYSRIRTRQADARIADLKAKGYQKKGNYKEDMAKIKLLSRTTDPQTVYIKDQMHRDDVVDITDFDVVAYQWKMMRHVLNEELAMAALVGDGREDGDPDKIHEDHIRSIWHDDELYCIHQDVDFEAAKTKLQGTNTGANFSENYIKAEAMIEAALYSREKFKGTGTPDVVYIKRLLLLT